VAENRAPTTLADVDDFVAVVGRVGPQRHHSNCTASVRRRVLASTSARSFPAPRAEFLDHFRNRPAAITGADS